MQGPRWKQDRSISTRTKVIWTLTITSIALFMVALDNLVVTTALPVIKRDLGASLAGLEWTVNAYTLTFAVLLLTGSALGDRFGRKRMFAIGLAVFTAGSAAAALAPTIGALIAARALEGVGGAIVMPLTLTILSAAVTPERRGVALGVWGAVGGLAVAIGPMVGGAVVDGMSWQWIFWLNVPIGLAALPLARARLSESTGPDRSLDLPGLALVSAGLFGIVFGLVRGNTHGWASLGVAGPLALGAALVAAFVGWELWAGARGGKPMIPLRFFARREFTAANAASLFMYFGMFGSIFLLAQFFQIVQGYSPLQAGMRALPWTAMPILVAPAAGALSDRIGARPLLVGGLGLLAGSLSWMAAILTPTVPYLDLVPPFVMAGVGMSLFFAPTANVVLSAVRRDQEGKASGVNNTFREVGGVFGVAVLATVFSAVGSYASPGAFVDGLTAAVWVGAAVVGLAAIVALTVPGRKALTLPRERPPDIKALPEIEVAAWRLPSDVTPAMSTNQRRHPTGRWRAGGMAARSSAAGRPSPACCSRRAARRHRNSRTPSTINSAPPPCGACVVAWPGGTAHSG